MFQVISRDEKITAIQFERPMRSISSAVLCGGMTIVRHAINATLDPNQWLEIEEMPDHCRDIARSFGCPPDETLVMLTAVPQTFGEWSENGLAFATVGLGNAVPLFPETIWDERAHNRPHTINCLSISQEPLSDGALIEAYGIAKIAAAASVLEWSSLYRKESVIGTPTDCLALLCPASEKTLRFAGLGTKIAYDLATETRGAIIKALTHKYPWTRQMKCHVPA